MTWTKLSDDFTDDCWTLSDQAFRLHVDGLVWSNRKLLDCTIPKNDVRRFAKDPAAAKELVAAGWWTDEGDAYRIRHHATYQRAKEKVLNQQEANKKNGGKGGRPKGSARELVEDLQKSHSLSDSLTESETKRDRTGQDRTSTKDETKEEADPWADQPSTRCPGCKQPMSRGLIAAGEASHPNCGARCDKAEQINPVTGEVTGHCVGTGQASTTAVTDEHADQFKNPWRETS